VGNSDGIGGHEPAATDETAIYKCGAKLFFPVVDEVVIFLVMHFSEVSDEK
jgi:ligand-binding sensor protein